MSCDRIDLKLMAKKCSYDSPTAVRKKDYAKCFAVARILLKRLSFYLLQSCHSANAYLS
jgi:hypothetical protein